MAFTAFRASNLTRSHARIWNEELLKRSSIKQFDECITYRLSTQVSSFAIFVVYGCVCVVIGLVGTYRCSDGLTASIYMTVDQH
jgi:hypothetical protein